MKKNRRSLPELPNELTDQRFSEALDDHYISNCRIAHETVDHEPEETLHFDRVVFENVNFMEICWPKSEFVDAVFINCDLSNADLSRCVFHRTEFRNSKLVGANFTEAGVRHTLFLDCILHYATFGFSLCNTVRFENSSLRQADFYDADLKNTEFVSCEMNDINFTETSLRGVDLSTNHFESIQVSVDQLAGCKVSSNQALAFARQLGMIIAEDY